MDIAKLIERVKGVVFSPRREWPVIAGETATTRSLYAPYILTLAAIPAVAGFIKGSLIGHGMFGIHVRVPVMAGLARMVVAYLLSLVLVYLVALVINALATRFDGRKDTLQALKTVCYAWTAAWVAGIAVIVPGLGWLLALAGGAYSIYLLYTGLPHTMQCPPERAGVYTAVSVVVAVVLGWVMALVVAGIAGAGILGGTMPGVDTRTGGSSVTFDADSRLGRLAALGKQMQAAGEEMERARASDDPQSRDQAMRAVVGAMTGSKDGKPVESLAPDKLRAFLPESLGDLERANLSSSRKGGMGIRMSQAAADYANADRSRHVRINLTDMPAVGGVMSMARAFGNESESRSNNGYEKTYVSDGRRIHEKWDSRSGRGEYGIMFGDRFQVQAKGKVGGMDELKELVGRLDLAGLERAGADHMRNTP